MARWRIEWNCNYLPQRQNYSALFFRRDVDQSSEIMTLYMYRSNRYEYQYQLCKQVLTTSENVWAIGCLEISWRPFMSVLIGFEIIEVNKVSPPSVKWKELDVKSITIIIDIIVYNFSTLHRFFSRLTNHWPFPNAIKMTGTRKPKADQILTQLVCN